MALLHSLLCQIPFPCLFVKPAQIGVEIGNKMSVFF